jgi:glucosamine--fructose-6-phosphate aminotransferase (isomerizing)
LAIPATKSVTATVAILLAAATLRGGNPARSARALEETADTVDAWLRDEAAMSKMQRAASQLAGRYDVMFLGTDYGALVAREAALKFKEATYLHAEGFEAGEFRHGSVAMLDASSALVGILDQDGREIVARALGEAAASGALRFTIGADIESIERLGPIVGDAYNTLAWLVTVHVLALFVSRLRNVEGDAPRGLTKAIVSE